MASPATRRAGLLYIVQGIGFLGAGLIIHNRSRVSGLTSAASVWVVASIGMACGAGLYAAAVVAAVTVVVAVEVVGFLERRANIKIYPLIYEARGNDQTLMLTSILDAMDKAGERLTGVERDTIGEIKRISFAHDSNETRHERARCMPSCWPSPPLMRSSRSAIRRKIDPLSHQRLRLRATTF